MKNNIVKSISYLEFINNLTSLVNNLLYAPENGYLSWVSKNAVLNFSDVIKKFDLESEKLLKNVDFIDSEKIVYSKKSLLIEAMQKHYETQIYVWADEVFEELIDNCIFQLSLNKEKSEELYKQLISSINWICEIKSYDNLTYKALFDEMVLKFNNVLNTNDEDYIPKQQIESTDFDVFCKLWDSALESSEEFILLDLSEFSNKLIAEDVRYFENIKTKLKTFKKTATVDELILISSGIEVLKIDNNKQKYDFIKKINHDFADFYEQNKKITDENKLTLVKRRISLFDSNANKAKNYFKKLIIS